MTYDLIIFYNNVFFLLEILIPPTFELNLIESFELLILPTVFIISNVDAAPPSLDILIDSTDYLTSITLFSRITL